MRERVLARFRFTGAAPAATAVLDACLTAALRARAVELEDSHPDLLHPARTALILMDDAAVDDVTILAAATLLDSAQPRWRGVAVLPVGSAPAELRAAVDLCDAVPTPETVPGDRLLEDLLVASPQVRLVACAERLDLVRHIHLVDPAATAACVRQVQQVYSPIAARTHPMLAARLERWASAFSRRAESS